MRRAVVLASLVLASLALLAAPAYAALYDISITKPSSSTVSGNVTVHVSSTGLNDPDHAAYEVRTSSEGWSESAKIGMSRVSGGFESTFDSSGYANGAYKILVRAWNNGIRSYNPNDSGSYASSSKSINISNAPPIPTGVAAYGGKGSASVAWYAVSTADRSDFAGYRVYRAGASGGCPAFGGDYQLQETTFSTTHSESGVSAGTYCFVVTATRTSPSSGTVESGPSDASSADVATGSSPPPSPTPTPSGSPSPTPSGSPSGSPSPSTKPPSGPWIRYGTGPGANAGPVPRAPSVAGGGSEGLGSYKENLPYGPQQVNQPVAGAAQGDSRTIATAGSDSRHQAKLLLAWGFLLVGVALIMRGFLTSPKDATAMPEPASTVEPTPVTDSEEAPRKRGRKTRR